MANVVIHDKKFEKPIKYYMDDKVKHQLDAKVIPALNKDDKDYLICIDGMEGGGKSTLAFQIGKYVDPSLDLSRVVFDAESFRQAIFKAKKGQCIVFDEAFTGLSSRASLSGINRALVSLMMQMRQKNLCIILVLPTFFLLDKYAALFRARVLFHVYENKGVRGYFRVYNKSLKKLLYIYGKKDYTYPRNIKTKMKGRFYGVFALGDEKYDKLYRKKKAKALEDTEKNPMTSGQVKYREQRDLMIYLLRKGTKMSYREMANYFGDYDFEVSHVQISKICAKFGDITTQKEKDENSKAIGEGKIEDKSSDNESLVEELDDIDHLDEDNDDFEDESDDLIGKVPNFNDN